MLLKIILFLFSGKNFFKNVREFVKKKFGFFCPKISCQEFMRPKLLAFNVIRFSYHRFFEALAPNCP